MSKSITPRDFAAMVLHPRTDAPPEERQPSPKPDDKATPIRSVPDEGLQRAIDEGVKRALAAMGIVAPTPKPDPKPDEEPKP